MKAAALEHNQHMTSSSSSEFNRVYLYYLKEWCEDEVSLWILTALQASGKAAHTVTLRLTPPLTRCIPLSFSSWQTFLWSGHEKLNHFQLVQWKGLVLQETHPKPEARGGNCVVLNQQLLFAIYSCRVYCYHLLRGVMDSNTFIICFLPGGTHYNYIKCRSSEVSVFLWYTAESRKLNYSAPCCSHSRVTTWSMSSQVTKQNRNLRKKISDTEGLWCILRPCNNL